MEIVGQGKASASDPDFQDNRIHSGCKAVPGFFSCRPQLCLNLSKVLDVERVSHEVGYRAVPLPITPRGVTLSPSKSGCRWCACVLEVGKNPPCKSLIKQIMSEGSQGVGGGGGRKVKSRGPYRSERKNMALKREGVTGKEKGAVWKKGVCEGV